MKIKWYGHAAFKITTINGVRIIIDPYQSGAFGGSLSYGKIQDEADIVLSSHDHDDHNYIKDIKGNITLIKKQGVYEEKGVKIRAIPTFHDQSKGGERGSNLIFIIEAEDVAVAHAGDLGHELDSETIKSIGNIDILMVPVGGFYTIDAEEATKVSRDLKPLVTIPMHFKTNKCDFPISFAEEFTKGKDNVKSLDKSEVEYTRATLPEHEEIVLLQHAL